MQEKEALMHCNPTRRTFLKGTAATAALAAVGTCSVAAWRAEQAEAAATGAVEVRGSGYRKPGLSGSQPSDGSHL